jgi:hypothetical protein
MRIGGQVSGIFVTGNDGEFNCKLKFKSKKVVGDKNI